MTFLYGHFTSYVTELFAFEFSEVNSRCIESCKVLPCDGQWEMVRAID